MINENVRGWLLHALAREANRLGVVLDKNDWGTANVNATMRQVCLLGKLEHHLRICHRPDCTHCQELAEHFHTQCESWLERELCHGELAHPGFDDLPFPVDWKGPLPTDM